MSIIRETYEVQSRFLQSQKEAQPELLKTFINLYPDTAHFIYELLQNAEDAGANEVFFELYENKLIFNHNGRDFNDGDIKAICRFGESTKQDDETAIGKFGIGFKSIFAYSKTPYIWSPSYNFKIEELILPSEIQPYPNLNGKTRFEFPFNHESKNKIDAFSETFEGLKDLSNTTLLFLKNIKKIDIIINEKNKVSTKQITKKTYPDQIIEINFEENFEDNEKSKSNYYLIFDQPCEVLEGRNIDLAYELSIKENQDEHNPNSKLNDRYKIKAAEKGELSIYFPAKKETTKLFFHINGPFQSTSDRSSIKNNRFNEKIIDELTVLFGFSLKKIKSLGLLDREFLNILPIQNDLFEGFYEKFSISLKDMMNNEELIPTHDGTFCAGKEAVRGTQRLRSLLNVNDLKFLNGYMLTKFSNWVIGTQRNTRIENLFQFLEIPEFNIEDFLDQLDINTNVVEIDIWDANTDSSDYYDVDDNYLNWLNNKDFQWFLRLYLLLNYYQKNPDYDVYFATNLIIKNQEGKLSKGSNTYFLSKEKIQNNLCTIHPKIFENVTKADVEDACAYLKYIGVTEFDEFQRMRLILEKRYSRHYRSSFDAKITDIFMFIKFYKENKENLGNLLDNYDIFYVSNPRDPKLMNPNIEAKEKIFARGSQIFLDEPYYHETGLKEYFEIANPKKYGQYYGLNYNLKKLNLNRNDLINLAKSCGAIDQIEVLQEYRIPNSNPDYKYLKSEFLKGARESDYKYELDHNIFGLENVMNNITKNNSLVIWDLLARNSQNKKILEAKYRASQNKTLFTAKSTLVHILRKNAWILTKSNNFLAPKDVSIETIHDMYEIDENWPWLEAIEFGLHTKKKLEEEKQQKELVKNLGLKPDFFEIYRKIATLDLSKEEMMSLLEKEYQKKQKGITSDDVKNPNLRSQRVSEEAAEAPEITYEFRKRLVPTHAKSQTKNMATQYLVTQYSNNEKKLNCQMCDSELPFKLKDGDYYFEKVKLFDFRQHHYQNYLALCPNHSKMLIYTLEDNENSIKQKILNISTESIGPFDISVKAGQKLRNIKFSKRQIIDLQALIKSENKN